MMVRCGTGCVTGRGTRSDAEPCERLGPVGGEAAGFLAAGASSICHIRGAIRGPPLLQTASRRMRVRGPQQLLPGPPNRALPSAVAHPADQYRSAYVRALVGLTVQRAAPGDDPQILKSQAAITNALHPAADPISPQLLIGR